MINIGRIDVRFIAGFGPIVRDAGESRKLYRDVLGITFKEESDGYLHTEAVAGAKSFALWPLSHAARSCFGTDTWPADIAVPQAWLEFDVDNVEQATAALESHGYRMLIKNKREPWGQTVSRFLGPEGLLVGITYTPRVPPRRDQAHPRLLRQRLARPPPPQIPRQGTVRRRRVLDRRRSRAARLTGAHRRRDTPLRRPAPLQFPRRGQGGPRLQPAPHLRRHAGQGKPAGGGHVRGQPRQPAGPESRVVGDGLVQAARLRADPPARARLPCVFYGDYFGNPGDDASGRHKLVSHRKLIDDFLQARAKHAYGEQHDDFDHPTCVGWFWTGDADHPGGLAVLLSTDDAGTKRMNTCQPGKTFRDLTGHWPEPVTAAENGEADFRCPAGSVSVWAAC